jgi:Sulfotransferase family
VKQAPKKDMRAYNLAGLDGEPFEDVEAYCMFVGYPKSGHSLIGSLLDAHPDAIIAHELDALGYIHAGFGKKQLYHLLLENSQEHASAGRGWSGYSYTVPGQWQGRFRKLRVIGDKKGAKSSWRLDWNPELLDRLREIVGVPVRFVHVIRNPYDNISTMFRQGVLKKKGDLRYNIEGYFSLCAIIRDLKGRTGGADVFDMRHELFVEDPARHLGDLCRFLGLESPDDYLEDCASIIFRSPNKSRRKVVWDPESISMVRNRMDEFDFLRGYSYED